MNRDTFIFVPAYNVERELPALLDSIPGHVLLRTRQILIIDDGSSDGTLAVAKAFAEKEIRTVVRVESFAKNAGYGAVVKHSLARALSHSLFGVRFAVCLHGDGQYPAAAIPEMLQVLEFSRASVVQGSRLRIPGAARQGGMPFYKFLGGKCLTWLEDWAFAQRLSDRHSGLLAYDTRFLRTIDVSKLSDSFDIDLEILAIADARGERLAEIPIPTRYADERSNLSVVSYGCRVLRLVLKKWRGFYG